MRLAIVMDGPTSNAYLGRLLSGLQRSHGIRTQTLIVPAAPALAFRGLAGAEAVTGWFAAMILRLETGLLRLAARMSPRMARRTAALAASDGEIGQRFAELIQLEPGRPLAISNVPDVVLIFGHWVPQALGQLPAHCSILQVLFGSTGRADLIFAGFEESNAGLDQTSVRIFRVEVPDLSRQLVIHAQNRTKPLFSLNHAACWDRASSLLKSQLGSSRYPQPEHFDVVPAAAHLPARMALRLLLYPARILGRSIRFAIRHVGGKRRWRVAIQKRGEDWAGLVDLLLTEAAPRGTYHADPLLYWHGATRSTYCFVEEYENAVGRAHIAVLREGADRGWERLGVVLREPYHLSFPFLFEYGGSLYMCPESGASQAIVVYRCVDFPLKWERCAVLMSNVSATDTMLFAHQGRWWMLTNLDRGEFPDHQSELHLFYADSPLSAHWQSAAGNPVKVDCRGARNGGLLVSGERILRFGQVQSFNAYGHRLEVYEIKELSPNRYLEEFVAKIDPPAQLGSVGIHTYSSAGGWIAVDLLGARR